MTLDEAIIHTEKVYERLKDKCVDCANEHQQLAQWLKDYKEIKSKEVYTMNKEQQIKKWFNSLYEDFYIADITDIEYLKVNIRSFKTNLKKQYKDFMAHNLKDLFIRSIGFLITKYKKDEYLILKQLETLLIKKNKDYNNSFDRTVDEYGYVVIAIRLEDKINRLNNLIKNNNEVKDESIEDTLLDIAGYCVLSLIYLENKEA